MRRFGPAIILGAAHVFLHVTLPFVDLLMHGALLASLYWGVRPNV